MLFNLTRHVHFWGKRLLPLLLLWTAPSAAQELPPPAPTTVNDTICGAGIAVLKADSELEGTPGLLYNWYSSNNASDLIKSVESEIFITPPIISAQVFYVSITLDSLESERTRVTAYVKNTASILESPRIMLCDSVVLHAGTTFSSDQLEDATFQWQHYQAQRQDDGEYVDLTDSLSRVGLSYVAKKPGFYRVIVTLPDGCRAISSGVEVTEENILDTSIDGSGRHCFRYPNEQLSLVNEGGRPFTAYLWEESLNGVDFVAIGSNEKLTLTNPTPAGQDSAVRYYRLTITEQNCSATSPIDSVLWIRSPEGEISRMGSKDDFFFCETDDDPFRTLKAHSDDDVTFYWQRIQLIEDYPLDFIKNVDLNDPMNAWVFGYFEPVESGDSVVLGKDDWGLYQVMVVDNVTECPNYTNNFFADSAIPLPLYAKDVICTGIEVLKLEAYDRSADAYLWEYSSAQAGPYHEISTSMDVSLSPPETTGEGWYRLTVTKNGCQNTSEPFFISEETAPPQPEISPLESVICPGESTALLSSSIVDSVYFYSWYELSVDSVISTSPYLDASIPGTYSMTLSNEFCGVTSEAAFVDALPVPEVLITTAEPSPPHCAPLSVVVDEPDPDYSYQWFFSTDSSTFDLLNGETGHDYLALRKGFLYAAAENEYGCTAISNVIEVAGVVNPEIQPFSDSVSICGSAPGALLKTSSYPDNEFLWLYSASLSEAFAAAEGSNDQPDYLAITQGYYKVRITDNLCSKESEPVYVQIEAGNPAFSAEITGNDKLCIGSSALFESKYLSASARYRWSYSLDSLTHLPLANGTTESLLLDSELFSPFTRDSLVVYLRLEVFDSLCSSASELFSLTLYHTPQIEVRNTRTSTARPTFLCDPEAPDFSLVAFQVNTNLPVNYQWQFLDLTGEFQDLKGATQKAHTPNFPATYRCAALLQNSECPVYSNEIVVTGLPTTVFTAQTSFCAGEAIELMADPQYQSPLVLSNYAYQWFYSKEQAPYEAIPSADGPYLSILPGAAAYGNSHFFYIATHDDCAATSDTIGVSEDVFPDYQMVIEDASCEGIQDGHIFMTGIDGYQVLLNDTLEHTAGSFESLVAGTYTLSVISSIGCRQDTVVAIANKQHLQLEVDAEDSQVKGIPFGISVDGADSYHWFPEVYFSSPFSAEPQVTIPENFEEDSVTIWVEGKSIDGCIALETRTIRLEVVDGLHISKFFSPNGDGVNDYLEIIGIKPGEETRLSIFDNWGKEVYAARNYANDSRQSELLNQALKKEGVYFYLLTTPDQQVKGSFYVKR